MKKAYKIRAGGNGQDSGSGAAGLGEFGEENQMLCFYFRGIKVLIDAGN